MMYLFSLQHHTLPYLLLFCQTLITQLTQSFRFKWVFPSNNRNNFLTRESVLCVLNFWIVFKWIIFISSDSSTWMMLPWDVLSLMADEIITADSSTWMMLSWHLIVDALSDAPEDKRWFRQGATFIGLSGLYIHCRAWCDDNSCSSLNLLFLSSVLGVSANIVSWWLDLFCRIAMQRSTE